MSASSGPGGGSVQALPPEVLCRVFSQTLPLPIKKTNPPYRLSVTTPLCISHVCQNWRYLSLSYGELWSFLCLEYDGSRSRSRVTKEIFDTWLSRTNGAPINFTVYCRLNSSDESQDHSCAGHFVRTLFQHQRRWKDVDFELRGVDLSPNFPVLRLDDMPALTSLSLVVALGKRVTISLARSTLVRSLDIRGLYSLSTGSEPLQRLTGRCRLYLSSSQIPPGCHAAKTCLDFLSSAPFLTEFEAKLCDDDRFNVPAVTLILLRDLRTLSLSHSFVPSSVLDNLTAPSLEALQYCSDLEKENILLRFIQRSMPPLTYLALQNACSEDEILCTLRLLPALTYLRCWGIVFSERFFRELATKNDDPESFDECAICPGLETLHLRAPRPTENRDASVDALIDMLKARANIQESFRTIDFNLDVDCGMTIDISEIDNYSGALKDCLWGWRGELIAGDHEFARDHSFPPPRSRRGHEPSPIISELLQEVGVDERVLRHFFPNFRSS